MRDALAPSDRQVFLAMPGYGELTAGAARGFWRATSLPDAQIVYEYREGSLLAANFNSLWVSALNRQRQGQRIDYFAMQHADVEPQDGWLDLLIEELETHDLDILGAVVPIKDSRGTTSLALARDDGDNWRPLCRLTMTEVYRLPPTFTSDDTGHPLLLNTGLWVCRFGPSWVTKVHFTINDRIVQEKGSGNYRAQTEPEDWYFSRLCHELQLRVGATRKVQLTHRGGAAFTSARPWGEPFDSAWIGESPVPDDLPGFRFPWDVDGWLRSEEGRELARLATGKRVLEIGSYLGLSTICLAQTAERVTAVDTFDGRGTSAPDNTFEGFSRNLSAYGLTEKVSSYTGTIQGLASRGQRSCYDLIFIDGDHSREAVESDIATCLPLLAHGGLIAFHDYQSPHDPGVTEAVDAFLASGAELLSVTSSLAVVRPPALTPSLLEV